MHSFFIHLLKRCKIKPARLQGEVQWISSSTSWSHFFFFSFALSLILGKTCTLTLWHLLTFLHCIWFTNFNQWFLYCYWPIRSSTIQYCDFSLFSFSSSKAHAVCLPVKHSVVAANEHISQNPQRPGGGWDIHCHKARQTNTHTHVSHLRKDRSELRLI